jgi:uncharacterized SAM-binding protein YcdF (DUF218 family)
MGVLVGKSGVHAGKTRLVKRVLLAMLIAWIAGELVLSTPLAAGILFSTLQIDLPLSQADLNSLSAGQPAAIVILAAGRRPNATEFEGLRGNETLDPLSLERVRYGAYLGHKTGLPILVSGGLSGPADPSLASLMADTLSSDYGIRAKWLEDRSSNTAENAIFSAGVLKSAGITRVILVTHAWHMKRSEKAFAANGLSVKPAPTAAYDSSRSDILSEITPGLGTLRMSGYAIHEIIGIAWYSFKYGY